MCLRHGYYRRGDDDEHEPTCHAAPLPEQEQKPGWCRW